MVVLNLLIWINWFTESPNGCVESVDLNQLIHWITEWLCWISWFTESPNGCVESVDFNQLIHWITEWLCWICWFKSVDSLNHRMVVLNLLILISWFTESPNGCVESVDFNQLIHWITEWLCWICWFKSVDSLNHRMVVLNLLIHWITEWLCWICWFESIDSLNHWMVVLNLLILISWFTESLNGCVESVDFNQLIHWNASDVLSL